MQESTINWLLEDSNPAVKYRTQTEILGQTADASEAKEWIFSKLPANWYETKGLWYTYYVTALAECGVKKEDVPEDYLKKAFEKLEDFQFGCEDFMMLRAMVMLGFEKHEMVKKVIGLLQENSLPDGGFLCLRRLKKLDHTPKSCYKADAFALFFLSELKKKNVDISFGQPVIDYFLKRDIFYKSGNKTELVLESTIETFHPFEPMRMGIHSFVESFSALGYGKDERLNAAWDFLHKYQNEDGKVILNQTLTKSYLPKEKAGKEGKWVTFYALLAEKEK